MQILLTNLKLRVREHKKFLYQFLILGTAILVVYISSWMVDPISFPFYNQIIRMKMEHKSWSQSLFPHFSWFSGRVKPQGYLPVGFNILGGYNFVASGMGKSNVSGEGSIPQSIKGLNGKKVAVQGYIVPVMVMDGEIKSFMLVKNTMLCCFGVTPKMNEWVDVEMANNKNTNLRMDIPMAVLGTLEVGEVYDEGVLMNIYRLKADDVVEVKEQS